MGTVVATTQAWLWPPAGLPMTPSHCLAPCLHWAAHSMLNYIYKKQVSPSKGVAGQQAAEDQTSTMIWCDKLERVHPDLPMV